MVSRALYCNHGRKKNQHEGKDMMTEQEIRMALENAKLSKVAEAAGIHPHTLYRFMKDSSRPLHSTIVALSSYLEARRNG